MEILKINLTLNPKKMRKLLFFSAVILSLSLSSCAKHDTDYYPVKQQGIHRTDPTPVLDTTNHRITTPHPRGVR